MDIDNDIDQTLLQKFSCLGTTDKEELIKQFQILVGNNHNESTASFFLDMNNWLVSFFYAMSFISLNLIEFLFFFSPLQKGISRVHFAHILISNRPINCPQWL